MSAKYFGMCDDPFRMTPDPAFIYNGLVHKSAFARLQAQLSRGQPVLLLAGGPGTGKTTVLKKLEEELSSDGFFVLFPGYSALPLEDILRTCCEEAGVPGDEIERLGGWEALRRALAARLGCGEKTALLVDEAQTMADEVLDELSRIAANEDGGTGPVQIVFSGHLELAERLARSVVPAARDAAVDPCRLDPLTLAEVSAYISHRLGVAGCSNPELFDPEAVRLIADLSSGIPRHINRISAMSLQLAQLAARKRVSADLVQDPAAMGGPSPALDSLLDASETHEAGLDPAPMADDQSFPVQLPDVSEDTLTSIPSFFVPVATAEAQPGPSTQDKQAKDYVAGQSREAGLGSAADRQTEAAPSRPSAARRIGAWQGQFATAVTAKRPGGSSLRYSTLGAGFVIGLLIGGIGMLAYLERPEGPAGGPKNPATLASGAGDVGGEVSPTVVGAVANVESFDEPASTAGPTTALAGPPEETNEQVTTAPVIETEPVDTTARVSEEAETATEQVTTPDTDVTADGQSPDVGGVASPKPAAEFVEAIPAVPPELVVRDVQGEEDEDISIGVSLVSPEGAGADDPAILISGLPRGARLSDGLQESDGTWRLAAADLSNLTLRPPAHFSGHFEAAAQVLVQHADGELTSGAETFAVTVNPVADAPVISAEVASGREDEPLSLSIKAELADVDGSETLALRVGDLPVGARLSAGVEDDGGFWSLRTEDLEILVLHPPPDFAGRFEIMIEAVALEADGQRAMATAALPVQVTPVADPPAVTVENAVGLEDETIALSVDATLVDEDGSETLSVVISGLPEGARLSAGEATADGGWRLAPDDLGALTLQTVENYSGHLDLAVEAVASEADGKRATTTGVLAVEVAPLADAPVLTVEDASGLEDEVIPLPIRAALSDQDGSETLSVLIRDLPQGARLSAGEATADGGWRLAPDDLGALTLQTAENYSGRLGLAIEAVASETDGKRATTTGVLAVEVAPLADAPVLTVEDTSGLEDEAIPLPIRAALSDQDGSETLSLLIGDLPQGTRLSAGAETAEGPWRVTPEDLAGLALLPAAGYSGRLDLAVKAVASETDGKQATTNGVLAVEVAPVADPPILVVEDTSGLEDEAIPLSINAALTDQDGSETLTISISGLPEGAQLSSGQGSDTGVWHLASDDLAGLELQTAAGYSGRLELGIEVAAQERGGERAVAAGILSVEVAPVADEPALVVEDAIGLEDDAIPLSIDAALSDPDGSEALSITISGLPEGARLSAGQLEGDGAWHLAAGDLAGLLLLAPADFSGRFDLAVQATAEEESGDSKATKAPLSVVVSPVADAPVLTVERATGREDVPVPLSIGAALSDRDGSETLSVEISGLPEGASLTAGNRAKGGAWLLAEQDLVDLAMVTAAGYGGKPELAVKAIAREADGAPAVSAGTLFVEVAPVPDDPVLTVENVSGREDDPLPLPVVAESKDPDGSEVLSIVLSGLPAGARLTAGDEVGEGRWRLGAEDVLGLALLPPVDFSGGFEVAVEATAEENGGGRATTRSTFSAEIAPVADPPLLVLDDAVGAAGQAIPLSISAARVDLDGSERLSVSIAGLPEGARLTAGRVSSGGDWRVMPSDLADLALEAPADLSGTFVLSVQAAAVEANGARAVTTTELTIDISSAQEPAALIADAAAAAESKVVDDLTEAAAAKTAGLPIVVTAQAKQDAFPTPGAEWMARGNQLMRLGDVAAARLYYELAADEAHPHAPTAVAKTYDPRYLEELGVLGTTGNPDKAVIWYQRGIDGGDAEAAERLSALLRWLGR